MVRFAPTLLAAADRARFQRAPRPVPGSSRRVRSEQDRPGEQPRQPGVLDPDSGHRTRLCDAGGEDARPLRSRRRSSRPPRAGDRRGQRRQRAGWRRRRAPGPRGFCAIVCGSTATPSTRSCTASSAGTTTRRVCHDRDRRSRHLPFRPRQQLPGASPGDGERADPGAHPRRGVEREGRRRPRLCAGARAGDPCRAAPWSRRPQPARGAGARGARGSTDRLDLSRRLHAAALCRVRRAFFAPHPQHPPEPAAQLSGPRRAGAALEYGVRVSGCTVHLVDAGLDSGPIVVQRAVPCSTATIRPLSRPASSNRSTRPTRKPFAASSPSPGSWSAAGGLRTLNP